MNIKRYIIGVVAAVFGTAAAMAQVDRSEGIIRSMLHGVEYEVYAGANIGGASPLPLPAEIREINSYNPQLNFHIGANVTKWLDVQKKWGVAVGLRLETKGMETKATVKNYGMAIIQDGATVSGRWTGRVQTRYHSQQLVVPVTAVFKAHRRLKVHAGPYLAFAFSNDFDGYVYEGYLRDGDPTGTKWSFEGDARASYDFGDDLRHFQWGMQGGVTWTAYKHLLVNANLAWGCNDIFKSSFKTVTFNLYPIYLNFGFGYLF